MRCIPPIVIRDHPVSNIYRSVPTPQLLRKCGQGNVHFPRGKRTFCQRPRSKKGGGVADAVHSANSNTRSSGFKYILLLFNRTTPPITRFKRMTPPITRELCVRSLGGERGSRLHGFFKIDQAISQHCVFFCVAPVCLLSKEARVSGPLFGPIFFHHFWLRNTGPPLLEGKFFKEDVLGFWAVLPVPFLGPPPGPKSGVASYSFFRSF